MKLIHCADVHLGSKMDVNLSAEEAKNRRGELRASFSGLLDYAKNNGVSGVLLCGDIFDSDRPFKKDKEFFYNAIKNNPEITFFYLRGNHDGEESFTLELENLKTFSRGITTYEFNGVNISGVELGQDNCTSIYSSLNLEKDKLNILMLHGAVGDASGKDRVNLNKLRNKNIDYLALGHIHYYNDGKIDERGVWAYPGCLEGRGFDEAGEKGFILLNTEDRITFEFVPFAKRKIHIFNVDISGATDDYSAYRTVKDAVSCSKNDMVRVCLSGEISFDNADLAEEIQKRMSAENYYVFDIKDKTKRKFDISALQGDISLRGEFIRAVLASAYSEDEKQDIISAGLKALDSREIDI
ncbi:MAG: metallophosphoesterase [Clostridiales bacterium]|nr:metallophosphoesterase [Clostridiales bacterium]